MTAKRPGPAKITRRQFGVYSGTAAVSLALAACDRKDDDAGEKEFSGELEATGERIEFRCYRFRLRALELPVSDVHIPFDGDVFAPSAPPGWGYDPDSDGVKFETPPPRPEGETRPREVPVPPGGSLGPFVFYLRKGTGTERSGPVTFSHPDGSTSPLDGRVEQGGVPVPLDADGSYHISPSGTAYCREIVIKAPANADVHDVHLERPPGGDPTKFVGVEPPTGWVSNPVDASIVTVFRPGGGPAIPAGESARFKVYYEQVNAQPNWRLTDERNETLPGAEGSLSL